MSIRPALKILAQTGSRTNGVAVDARGFATESRLSGSLLGDPGVSFVELDPAGSRDLGGE